ncbi:hypothetical protein [Mycobacterium leprae]|uniref:hypothetical protein n=1 Tax=Mycobacterium leprae TaxID=1769 RepID=UPI0002EF7C5E|nr:hypothetical protein [Mycobacterium leprae]
MSDDVAIIVVPIPRLPASPRDFWCVVRDGREVTQSAVDNVVNFDANFLSPR